jgi:hypothetical protein
VPARRGAIAQATQDFQGKCFIGQYHPDGNVRKKLSTGKHRGDLKKWFGCVPSACGKRGCTIPSEFFVGFLPYWEIQEIRQGLAEESALAASEALAQQREVQH